MPMSFRFTCRLFTFLAVGLIAARVSGRGTKNESEFAPRTMGWRAAEFHALTNVSHEKFATEARKFREAGGKGDPSALLTLEALYAKGYGQLEQCRGIAFAAR